MVDGVDKRTEDLYLVPRYCRKSPLQRFGVEHNSLLENSACARMWPFNTSLAHARYGISLHVPRLHSDGAPGPRLPIRACTPGQKIIRLVGRCRSTPCDPHEQIYRYIVHSVPREPPHALIPGPGRRVLHTLVPTCFLGSLCPVIRGRSVFQDPVRARGRGCAESAEKAEPYVTAHGRLVADMSRSTMSTPFHD